MRSCVGVVAATSPGKQLTRVKLSASGSAWFRGASRSGEALAWEQRDVFFSSCFTRVPEDDFLGGRVVQYLLSLAAISGAGVRIGTNEKWTPSVPEERTPRGVPRGHEHSFPIARTSQPTDGDHSPGAARTPGSRGAGSLVSSARRWGFWLGARTPENS